MRGQPVIKMWRGWDINVNKSKIWGKVHARRLARKNISGIGVVVVTQENTVRAVLEVIMEVWKHAVPGCCRIKAS